MLKKPAGETVNKNWEFHNGDTRWSQSPPLTKSIKLIQRNLPNFTLLQK